MPGTAIARATRSAALAGDGAATSVFVAGVAQPARSNASTATKPHHFKITKRFILSSLSENVAGCLTQSRRVAEDRGDRTEWFPDAFLCVFSASLRLCVKVYNSLSTIYMASR